MVDETLQTLWNFDGAELNLIFQIKMQVAIHLTSWNLENAYWSLRDLRRELDAKFKTDKKEEVDMVNEKGEKEKIKLSEKEIVDRLLEEVEAERTKFLIGNQDQTDISRFYQVIELFYMHLASLMKKHGLYFREGDDPSQAFRRR